MSDDLDKTVEELKKNAIVPLVLRGATKASANAVDNGMDEDFLARLQRGEHLNGDFLKHAHNPKNPVFAIGDESNEESLSRFERGEHLDDNFLRHACPPLPEVK